MTRGGGIICVLLFRKDAFFKENEWYHEGLMGSDVYHILSTCHLLCSGLSLALLHSWLEGRREGFAQGSLLEFSLLPAPYPPHLKE